MSWVKIDDRAREHRKLLAVGPTAAWLWACGLMYANGQKARDGFIPGAAVPMLYPIPTSKKEAAKLVDAGLWREVDGGYQIHDYHDYQPRADQAEALSAKRAQAGRAGGQRSGEVRRSKQVASAESKQVASEATNPDPDPDPDPGPIERERASAPTPAPAARPKRSGSRKTHCPASSASADELHEWARAEGIDSGHPEFAKFIDRNRAVDASYVDWGAAWRVWLSRAPQFTPRAIRVVQGGKREAEQRAAGAGGDNWREGAR